MIDDRDHYQFDPENFAEVIKELFFNLFLKHPLAGGIDEMASNNEYTTVFLDTSESASKLRKRIQHMYKRQSRDKKRYENYEIAMAFWLWIVRDNLTQSVAIGKTMKQVKATALEWRGLNEDLDLFKETITSQALLDALTA